MKEAPTRRSVEHFGDCRTHVPMVTLAERRLMAPSASCQDIYRTYIHRYDVSPKKLYSFWITGRQAEGLKAVKSATDITESEQIRRALDDWLEKNAATLKADRKRARTRKRP